LEEEKIRVPTVFGLKVRHAGHITMKSHGWGEIVDPESFRELRLLKGTRTGMRV
jgi:hypothetical protein